VQEVDVGLYCFPRLVPKRAEKSNKMMCVDFAGRQSRKSRVEGRSNCGVTDSEDLPVGGRVHLVGTSRGLYCLEKGCSSSSSRRDG